MTSMKVLKSLQGSLRAICLEAGASLIYTSALNDVNCKRLQKFISFQLFPAENKVSMEDFFRKSQV